jgi:hypothetical protein
MSDQVEGIKIVRLAAMQIQHLSPQVSSLNKKKESFLKEKLLFSIGRECCTNTCSSINI